GGVTAVEGPGAGRLRGWAARPGRIRAGPTADLATLRPGGGRPLHLGRARVAREPERRPARVRRLVPPDRVVVPASVGGGARCRRPGPLAALVASLRAGKAPAARRPRPRLPHRPPVQQPPAGSAGRARPRGRAQTGGRD